MKGRPNRNQKRSRTSASRSSSSPDRPIALALSLYIAVTVVLRVAEPEREASDRSGSVPGIGSRSCSRSSPPTGAAGRPGQVAASRLDRADRTAGGHGDGVRRRVDRRPRRREHGDAVGHVAARLQRLIWLGDALGLRAALLGPRQRRAPRPPPARAEATRFASAAAEPRAGPGGLGAQVASTTSSSASPRAPPSARPMSCP